MLFVFENIIFYILFFEKSDDIWIFSCYMSIYNKNLIILDIATKNYFLK